MPMKCPHCNGLHIARLGALLCKHGGHVQQSLLPQVLKTHPGPISVKDISEITKFTTDDIINTLRYLDLIQFHKGQHVICAVPEAIERCACGSTALPSGPIFHVELWKSQQPLIARDAQQSTNLMLNARAAHSRLLTSDLRLQTSESCWICGSHR